MPIYAYRCESCGFTKDALQKVSDAPLTDCPSCGKPTLKKQVTAAGFQLKGTGWYVTDFRNGTSAPAPAQSDAKSEVKAESKSEAKSEAKSEGPAPSSSGTADAA